MKINKISLDECKNRFNFDENGNLYWKIQTAKSIKVGSLAGYLHPSGYRYVKINGKCVLEHRILYQLYHNIELTNEQIDHIDGNTKNNSKENLRKLTHSQNQMNKKCFKSNKTTGIKNITILDRGDYKDYRICITKDKKISFSKYYNTNKFSLEEIIEIRNNKLLELHGNFACFG